MQPLSGSYMKRNLNSGFFNVQVIASDKMFGKTDEVLVNLLTFTATCKHKFHRRSLGGAMSWRVWYEFS